MTKTLIGLVLAALLAYGLFEARPLLVGPVVALASPEDGASYPGGIVTIEGRASRVAALTLDGAPLLPDQSGHFAATLAFPRGGSILTLVASDRFGRTVTKERLIYVP